MEVNYSQKTLGLNRIAIGSYHLIRLKSGRVVLTRTDRLRTLVTDEGARMSVVTVIMLLLLLKLGLVYHLHKHMIVTTLLGKWSKQWRKQLETSVLLGH